MLVKLREQVPAFRLDDRVLERLWRGVEAKWAGEQPEVNTFTVRERVRVAGRRAREEHQHDYQSVEELRRTPGGPDVLRNYTLAVSSRGKESREVRFGASGDGDAATVEVNAADAAWCREVADTVLELLRPHTLWYAAVHRISLWVALAAMIATLGGLPLAISYGSPQWTVLVVALYLACLVVIAFRDLIFPAADILVRRRGTQSAAPGGGSWESPEIAGVEPARPGPGDVVGRSGRREPKRSEGGATTLGLTAWLRSTVPAGDHGFSRPTSSHRGDRGSVRGARVCVDPLIGLSLGQ